MSLKKIADTVVESFTNVFTFEVDPSLSEPEQVEKVTSETAIVAGMIASVQPLPFVDLFVLAPLYAKLTLQIGRMTLELAGRTRISLPLGKGRHHEPWST